ncbi:hypothetical protein CAC02_09660 [Streptococcus gallolyticus]|uniref:Uncharacterized protein n=1 Tax=Streptococcus gallolyticus TaxID=315405 RepID=A0A368UC52_9STRE|nr:hypothetical protein CAC02_09660 [Streptococcus gallolyticus]
MNEKLLKFGNILIIVLTLMTDILWFISISGSVREDSKIFSAMILFIFLSFIIDLLAHYFLKKNSIDYRWQRQQIILISCAIGFSLLVIVSTFSQRENILGIFLMLADSILLLFYPNSMGYKNNTN